MPVPRRCSAGRLIVLCLGLGALAACQRTPAAAAAHATVDDPAAARIRADVRVLADDRMQGREAGTPGFDRAADYVAQRFHAIGLQPAGDDGSYFQRVPLLRGTRVADGARLDVVRADRSIVLRFRDHFLPEPDYDRADSAVRAPALFVGQGIHAPELGHDDFAGLDLHGKIAVLLGGAPARFDNDRRAFYSSTREKLRALAERGAVGAVFVNTAQDEAETPWARQAGDWERPGLRLRGADGHAVDSFPQLRVVARVAFAAADLVFDGSGHTAAELARAAQDDTLHGFALPVVLSLAARTRIESVESRNVLARLPGTDPARRDEQVVFSAHLDHLGVGPPVAGDRIYNGALDNALGVAILLQAARESHEARPAPRRSLLFAAVTAEEKGLLGAQWLATHPPGTPVADINMDMPMLLAPTRDVVPIGLAHSSLQGVVEQAAKSLDIALSADPFPEENVFVRSDQYAFVRAGVPAVYLGGGVLAAAASAGLPATVETAPALAQREFLRHCYHQPCDDLRQPIQYPDAARLARLNARIGLLVANADAAPRWNPGDFFGTRFTPPAPAP